MSQPYFYDELAGLASVEAGDITLKIPFKPEHASQSPYLIKRANNMGFILTHLDAIGESFVEFCRLGKPSRVVDLDVSYGITTACLLQEKIAHVIATDNHPVHLNVLKTSIPQEYAASLSLLEGDYPEDLSFENESIDAFHSCRMFHFYNGAKIEKILHAVLKSLKKEGRFYVSTDTPYWGIWKEKGFLKKFEENQKMGKAWPGFMENVEHYVPELKQNVPISMNFLDAGTARLIFEKAGLKIEEIYYFSRSTYPADLLLDGREGLGIVAVKP